MFTDSYERLQQFYGVLDWYRVMNLAGKLLASYPDVLAAEQSRLNAEGGGCPHWGRESVGSHPSDRRLEADGSRHPAS